MDDKNFHKLRCRITAQMKRGYLRKDYKTKQERAVFDYLVALHKLENMRKYIRSNEV